MFGLSLSNEPDDSQDILKVLILYGFFISPSLSGSPAYKPIYVSFLNYKLFCNAIIVEHEVAKLQNWTKMV